MDRTYGAVFVAGGFIGAGLVWIGLSVWGPSEQPKAATPIPQEIMATEIKPPRATDAPKVKPPSDALKACQSTLKQIKDAYAGAVEDTKDHAEVIELLEELVQKSGADTPEGHPMAWPEDIELDDAYKPEGFKAALDKLKEVCPDQFPQEASADCSEFPCAIHQVVDETHGSWDHKMCPAFAELFGSGTMSWGSGGYGADTHVMHVIPVPEGSEARAFLEEHEGNLRKRSRQRLNAFQQEYAQANLVEPCEGGDAQACAQLAKAYRGTEQEQEYLQQGCEHGSGSACNNLAWSACHDRSECGDEALAHAKRATELKPEDGQGAWDTYAYVLCQRGETAAAHEAYRRSCEAGYAKNCGKTCP